MTEPAPNSEFSKRADNLETLFDHLEKTTRHLDDVIGDGQQEFEELKRRVERLAKVVQKKPPVPGENQEPGDEAPPSEHAA